MRKIIYTYIFGGHDWLMPPIKITPGWEYVCFTDEENPWHPDFPKNGWEIMRVQRELEPKRAAGFYLTHGMEIFDHDIVMSVTGQIHVIGDLDEFTRAISFKNYSLMKHPTHRTTWEEANKVTVWGKDDKETVKKQMRRYLSEDFPGNGMVQTGIIVRENNLKNRQLERFWWEEICRGSKRDQLSFMYSLWRHPVEVEFYDHTKDIQNTYLAVVPHYRTRYENPNPNPRI